MRRRHVYVYLPPRATDTEAAASGSVLVLAFTRTDAGGPTRSERMGVQYVFVCRHGLGSTTEPVASGSVLVLAFRQPHVGRPTL